MSDLKLLAQRDYKKVIKKIKQKCAIQGIS